MTMQALPRALDLGGWGYYYYYHYDGVCGPNLEDPTPYSYIRPSPKTILIHIFFPRGNPMGFAFAHATVCVYTQGQILVPCSYANCSLNILTPHFYIVKLGSTGLLIISLFQPLKHRPGYPLEPPPWCGSSV